MRSDKEIQKLKLSLTQACCLRCVHCFVEKGGSQTITLRQAQQGLDLFLSSPGKNKKLELAGGEAFMRFRLLKDIVLSAEKLAGKYGKKLEVWVASNGLCLNRRHLQFIKKHNIVLSISIYGTAATQDAIRRLPGGGGSFAPLKRKVKEVLSYLGPHSVTALLCVHPAHTGRLYEDFAGLLEMGFSVFNIECVHGIPWPEKSAGRFRRNIGRIVELVRSRILAGHFIVFEGFVYLIKNRSAGKKSDCPLFRDLEIYPDGSLSLYPYGFVDVEKYGQRVYVGSVESGLAPRFLACRLGSGACRTCVKDYYCIPGMADGASSYSFCTNAVFKLFHSLAAGGDENPVVKSYIKKLVNVFG